MKNIVGLLWIILKIGLLVAYGQVMKQIDGFVYDDSTGTPLSGVEVVISELNEGTVTDANGRFVLKGINSGTFEIVFSHIGYRKKSVFVTVLPDRTVTLNIGLKRRFINFPSVVKVGKGGILAERISNQVIVIKNDGSAESLAELLARDSRIVVRKDVAGNSVVQIAGSSPEHVLVLVDGQPISDSKKGYVSLDVIPVELIERVEVVSGGASALSGSDAIGGVVNIVTKSRTKELLTASLLFGSYGFNRQSFSYSPVQKWLDFIVGFSSERARNDFLYRNQFGEWVKRDNNQRSILNLFVKVNMKGSEGEVASLFSFSRGVYGSPGSIYSPSKGAKNEVSSFISNIAFCSGNVSLKTSYSSFLNHYMSDGGMYPPMNTKYRISNCNILVESKLEKEEFGLGMRTGLKLERMNSRDLLRAAFSMGNHERNNYFVGTFVDLKHDIGGFRVKALLPLRFDYSRDFGSMFSYRAGLSISSFGALLVYRIGIEAGNGFKLPTFNQMFWVQDAYSMGNPHLRPEKSRGTNLSLSLSFRNRPSVNFGIDYLQNFVSDLIVWRRGYANKYFPVNVEKAYINNLDVHADMRIIRSLEIRVGLSKSRCLNLTREPNIYKRYIPYRPLSRGFLTLNFIRGGIAFSILNHYFGRSYITEANTIFLEPFWLTDVVVSYSFGVGNKIDLRMLFKINNLFNREYYFLEFYPMPGRTFDITIKLAYK